MVNTSKFPKYVQVFWSNSYCKKTLLEEVLFSFCLVCVCWSIPCFFKMRPWKSTWSSSKIQTTNMRNHKWAFQYFMGGESEQFVNHPQFTVQHLDICTWTARAFDICQYNFTGGLAMGNDVKLGLWEKILIRCMDGSFLCTLGIWRTRATRDTADGELGFPHFYLVVFEILGTRNSITTGFRLHLNPCRLRHPASGSQLQCKLRATLHRYGEPRGWKRHIFFFDILCPLQKAEETAMFKKKNISMNDILYNWWLVVSASKFDHACSLESRWQHNRHVSWSDTGSDSCSCRLSISRIFVEFFCMVCLWVFFSDGRLFLNLGKGWKSKYMSTYTHITYIYIMAFSWNKSIDEARVNARNFQSSRVLSCFNCGFPCELVLCWQSGWQRISITSTGPLRTLPPESWHPSGQNWQIPDWLSLNSRILKIIVGGESGFWLGRCGCPLHWIFFCWLGAFGTVRRGSPVWHLLLLPSQAILEGHRRVKRKGQSVLEWVD